jgi:hypothetical protein
MKHKELKLKFNQKLRLAIENFPITDFIGYFFKFILTFMMVIGMALIIIIINSVFIINIFLYLINIFYFYIYQYINNYLL